MLQDSDSDVVEVDLLDPSKTDVVGKLSFSCFVEVCITYVLFYFSVASSHFNMVSFVGSRRNRKGLCSSHFICSGKPHLPAFIWEILYVRLLCY